MLLPSHYPGVAEDVSCDDRSYYVAYSSEVGRGGTCIAARWHKPDVAVLMLRYGNNCVTVYAKGCYLSAELIASIDAHHAT